MKRIYIHDKPKHFYISRQVETVDGLPIQYGPVYTFQKKEFDIQSFSDAVFSSFDGAGVVVDIPPFSESREAYNNYKTNILKEYKERSFQQLAKKSNLFMLDWEGQTITFLPTFYSDGGSEGDDDYIETISIHRKLKVQIAQEIINLINEYKSIKGLA